MRDPQLVKCQDIAAQVRASGDSMRTGRAFRWILVGVFVALLAGPATAEDRVPGTAVTLTPPVGFSAASQFTGFQNEKSGASIAVTEVPAPVRQLLDGLDAPKLATQGMKLIASSEVTVAGRNALLLHVVQTASGIEFEKWMLILGDDSRAVLLVGTFPQAISDAMREPVKSALLSAMWDPSQAIVTTENLPFGISETADLKISKRMSTVLILTKGGSSAVVTAEDPLLVVGTSISDADLSNLEAFARTRILQTAQLEDIEIIQGRTAEPVDGLSTYELEANARDQRSGIPVRVYQLLIGDGRRYFLVQGIVGTSQAEQFVPQFREVARSLRRAK